MSGWIKYSLSDISMTCGVPDSVSGLCVIENVHLVATAWLSKMVFFFWVSQWDYTILGRYVSWRRLLCNTNYTYNHLPTEAISTLPIVLHDFCHILTMLRQIISFQKRECSLLSWHTMRPLILRDKLVYLNWWDTCHTGDRREITASQWV